MCVLYQAKCSIDSSPSYMQCDISRCCATKLYVVEALKQVYVPLIPLDDYTLTIAIEAFGMIVL